VAEAFKRYCICIFRGVGCVEVSSGMGTLLGVSIVILIRARTKTFCIVRGVWVYNVQLSVPGVISTVMQVAQGCQCHRAVVM